jgi:tetratricopeptide (TPR) repeat protein
MSGDGFLQACEHITPLHAQGLHGGVPRFNLPTTITCTACCSKPRGSRRPPLRAWEKALSRAPNQADWHLEYARLLYQTGRLDDALKAVQQILAQAPQNVPARALHKAILYKLTGRE